VEGATVGAHNYTFRRGPDVINGQEIPAGFRAVLAGHIHRAQTLTHDLNHNPLPAPVVYPGAIERTSFAERNEAKGYVFITVPLSPAERVEVEFVPLPARPMHTLTLGVGRGDARSLRDRLRQRLAELDPDSIVRVEVSGPASHKLEASLSAATLRQLAPPTMNITLAPMSRNRTWRRSKLQEQEHQFSPSTAQAEAEEEGSYAIHKQ
jgi:DNA repair exonuclease SbcCD nuclease subunit